MWLKKRRTYGVNCNQLPLTSVVKVWRHVPKKVYNLSQYLFFNKGTL